MFLLLLLSFFTFDFSSFFVRFPSICYYVKHFKYFSGDLHLFDKDFFVFKEITKKAIK